MEKIEVGKKNFEEFVNGLDCGIDGVGDTFTKMTFVSALMASRISTMVKEEHQNEILDLITEFEECAEHLGVIRFINQMLKDKGDSNE